MDPYPYDPSKAKKLLADAGFAGGKYPDGRPISFQIHTWEAGDTPLLPELSQLFAEAWKKELGLQVEVVVGDSASVRQKWNNRQLPGHMLIRTNEARYDGTSIMIGGWTNPDTAWRVNKDPRVEPWLTDANVANKALNDLNPQTRQKSFAEAWRYFQDQHVWWSAFYTNLPWGIGPKVKDYKPWSLVPYVTAIWTVEMK
jgi:ABC-type transport system substrate-binding protein